MQKITPPTTWHVLASSLTPQQVAFLWRCDRNPDHPAGADAHRRGMIRLALMIGAYGPGGLN